MAGADLLESIPAVSDLRERARRRMPHLPWEYLDSGTGSDLAVARNRIALDALQITPRVLKPVESVNLETRFLGRNYDLPFGIAPIGMTGLMWPGGETMCARTAASHNIPYCLSTVACETPEDIGVIAGANGWFQLYTFADWNVNTDILKRAGDAGFSNLLITLDVPAPSMRERQRRAGLRMPPKTTPGFVLDVLRHPAWLRATIKRGRPSLRTLEKYAKKGDMRELTGFVAAQRIGDGYVWDDIKRFRDIWDGPITLKGIMSVEDAKLAVKAGVDAIVVSNHGGRQFDAAPASITVLPEIAAEVKGKTEICFDSGVRTGLDIIRAIALGADFVLAGRPFIYGAAALGEAGTDHVVTILKSDLATNMRQAGLADIAAIRQQEMANG